jgi:transcriptional regulator with XRE-family HTH domain
MSKSKSIHSSEYSELIESLTRERKRLGLSQADVARAIGMSQSDVSKIENQERRVDVLEFKKMVQAYRIHSNPHLKKVVFTFLGVFPDES